jgi:DivIVA domain-containing protein
MGQLLLFIVVAVVVAAIVFGVTVMLSGGDSGLTPVEADGRAVPLPSDRPLGEEDISLTKFDVTWRGYRMAQVDQALQRAAYDIGYKGELIGVLEAEVIALRDGRLADADVLRRAREAAVAPVILAEAPAGTPAETSADQPESRVIEVSVNPADPAPEVADDEVAPVAVDRVPAGPVSAGPVPAGPVSAGPVPAGPVSAGPVPAGEPVDAVPGDGTVEESEAAERR